MKFIYSTRPLYSFAVWYYHKYPCNALAEKRKELNPLFGYQIIQRILEKIRRMQWNIIFQFKQLGLTLLRIRLTICLHTVLCRRRTKFEMIWKSTRKMSSIRKSKYEAIYLSEKWRIERNGNTKQANYNPRETAQCMTKNHTQQKANVSIFYEVRRPLCKEKTLFTCFFHVRISPKRICLRRKQKKSKQKLTNMCLTKNNFKFKLKKRILSFKLPF